MHRMYDLLRYRLIQVSNLTTGTRVLEGRVTANEDRVVAKFTKVSDRLDGFAEYLNAFSHGVTEYQEQMELQIQNQGDYAYRSLLAHLEKRPQPPVGDWKRRQYEGYIKECPQSVPGDLVTQVNPSSKVYVWVYIKQGNRWHKAQVMNLEIDACVNGNIVLSLEDDFCPPIPELFNFKRLHTFMFTKENYGYDKLWILPDDEAERKMDNEINGGCD